MSTPATSTFLNQRYGSINLESDDDVEEKKEVNDSLLGEEEDEEQEEEKGFNSHVLSEVELAEKSRADTSFVRATDHHGDLGGVEDESQINPSEVVDAKSNHQTKDTDDINVESMSEQTLKDAIEFESLLFSVRRTSARARLLKFISTLKQISAKFRREEEVKLILLQLNGENPESTTNGSLKRSISDSDSSTNHAPSRKRSRTEDNQENEQNLKPIFADTALTNSGLVGLTNLVKSSKSNNIAKICSSIPTSNPPSLKDKDEWVKLHKKDSELLCPDFSLNNTCILGSKCPRKHVYTPPVDKPNCKPMTKKLYESWKLRSSSTVDVLGWYSKFDLEKAYDLYRKSTLTKESFCDKIKPDDMNVSYYTSCFICPVDNTIYYSQPFPGDLFVNGNKSSQGIWWYLNVKDARDIVATQVIRHLQERKIIPIDFKPDLRSEDEIKATKKKTAAKAAVALVMSASMPSKQNGTLSKPNNTLPSKLPEIRPWNWAEIESGSCRCALFTSPQGCPYGATCQFTHVNHPMNVITDRFPSKEALPAAYYQLFGVHIQDYFFQQMIVQQHASNVFHVKTIVDNQSQIWYTAAWKCPHERTIYYAAGGTSGRSNPQGFLVYPSIEDAKLAVCGVVLTAFFARGFRGSWTQGYLS